MSSASHAANSEKQIVIELSTMRSGSTLLKALLGSLDDTSSLPEIDFQKFQSPDARQEIEALSDKPIVILKRPAWFNEGSRYPKLPNAQNLKRVILTRDVATNIISLRKMVFRKIEPFIPQWMDIVFANLYWAPVYKSLLKKFPKDDTSNFWLRYEDLVENPIFWTNKLFTFIGAKETDGIDSYRKPEYKWQWGTDDGGDKIKSLKVQPNPLPVERIETIHKSLKNSPGVHQARRDLGYA
ncbi:sulfotransferase [Puniceicoccaceae bacterium K14]|nr:sulfotransferase [Puniceicoccaceae bacterium K14]